MGDGRLDDLDVTREELDSIGEALKSEKFRKLLCEYVDEINDPANREQYEREVAQYERERGAEVTFVRPRPGYVVKTSADGVRKVFVNVCACDAVDKPTVDAGRRWSLPHCLSPVRRDYDNARRPCDVYDVVFHPDALGLAGRDRAVRDMVEDTALTVIEKNDGVVLDRANVKYPKIKFKGVARPLIIRRRIDGFRPCAADAGETERLPPGCPTYKPPPVDRPVQHHDLDASTREKSPFAVPKYVIKYRTDVDIQEHAYNMLCKMNAVIPKQLIVEIHLPLLDSSANMQLDVLPKSLTLVCHKPSKYRLDIGLPYSVLDDQGDATFDQSTRKLIVRLPVSRTEPSLEYVSRPVEEVRTTVMDGERKNSERENGEHHNVSTGPESSDDTRRNDDGVAVTNGRRDENTVCDDDCDVHYTLPEHEFICGSNCVLTLHVKNVDPTSINLIVVNDTHSVSGKFHNVGSGFFPIWFAFCIQIPSESSLLNSDLKVIPSDNNLVLEFSARFKPDCKQYWYGLDQDHLTIQCIETGILEKNSKPLVNNVPDRLNDSDDDDENDDYDNDVLDSGKREAIASNNGKQENAEKRDDVSRCKDKNGKITAKEKRKKKKSKKMQKSNAIPIVVAGGLPESGKKIDFVAGSLPIEFNNTRPTIRGILKKRSLSECSNADETILYNRIYSSSVDNVDTESSDVLESSLNDLSCKKTVRFNDHVIEKKINYNLSIAAQAKKHRQRQQRKRNIREYSTPSESEASEAEDKIYGPLNVVSESEETSVSESSTGEMSDDSSNGPTTTISSKVTVVSDSKKDHKRRKSKSARKNASLAKQTSTNSLIFPIEY